MRSVGHSTQGQPRRPCQQILQRLPAFAGQHVDGTGPEQLLPLARLLQAQGTQRLVLLMPHAPAQLPQALAQGLASLDEAALVAMGFEHLVILRAARPAGTAPATQALQRLAQLWLDQLRWMVPTRQQPLRPAALARCVAERVMALPRTPPGTRVVAPETLWQWVQELEAGDGAAQGQSR
jgi:hypothetical protein